MSKLTLACSADQWRGLMVAVDKSRSTSKSVTVDKAALDLLMRDHSKLIAVHKADLAGAL